MPDKPISNIDVVRSYIGLLALGKSDYEAITDMRDDRFFQESMGLKEIPSAETLRQRFDEIAVEAQPIVSSTCTEFIHRAKGRITPLASGHVPLDIDVFCMDNSGTKKEGTGYTCHGYHGYAPIAAYLGEEGWCLNLEFREGSQHSQNNFIPFLQESLARAGAPTKRPLLLRLDSAHDVVETRATISGHRKADSILKWIPRKHDRQALLERGLREGKVSAKQQAFLDFVLQHCVSLGVEELDQEKLPPLLRLRYQDSIADAIADLGRPEEIGAIFTGFQHALCQEVAATIGYGKRPYGDQL